MIHDKDAQQMTKHELQHEIWELQEIIEHTDDRMLRGEAIDSEQYNQWLSRLDLLRAYLAEFEQ